MLKRTFFSPFPSINYSEDKAYKLFEISPDGELVTPFRHHIFNLDADGTFYPDKPIPFFKIQPFVESGAHAFRDLNTALYFTSSHMIREHMFKTLTWSAVVPSMKDGSNPTTQEEFAEACLDAIDRVDSTNLALYEVTIPKGTRRIYGEWGTHDSVFPYPVYGMENPIYAAVGTVSANKMVLGNQVASISSPSEAIRRLLEVGILEWDTFAIDMYLRNHEKAVKLDVLYIGDTYLRLVHPTRGIRLAHDLRRNPLRSMEEDKFDLRVHSVILDKVITDRYGPHINVRNG